MVVVTDIPVPLHRNQIRIASYPAQNSRRYLQIPHTTKTRQLLRKHHMS